MLKYYKILRSDIGLPSGYLPRYLRKPKDRNWRDVPRLSLKFIDDGANVEKINLKDEPLLESEGKQIKIVIPGRTRQLL